MANQTVKRTFDTIAGRCAGFNDAITEVFQNYAKTEELAHSEANRYKDEDAIYQQRHQSNLALATERYTAATEQFAGKIIDDAKALKGELEAALAEPAPRQVIERCGTLMQFGISPSKTEINQLLQANGGNLTGLRIIQRTLDSTGSLYRVDFKGPDEYEADLSTIESLADLAHGYTPVQWHTGAVSLLAGQQIRGAAYGVTWDRTSLLIRRALFSDTIKRIQEIGDSWAEGVSYRLREVEPIEPEDPDAEAPVMPASSTKLEERTDSDVAEAFGRSIGQARAQAAKNAAEAMAHYQR